MGDRRADRRAGGARGRVRFEVAALDEAARAQLVDQARQRDRRQVQRLGQFALIDPLATLKTHQHRPLRAGHVQFASALVGVGAQEPRGVVQRKSELAGRGIGHSA